MIAVPLIVMWRVFKIKKMTRFTKKNLWGYYFISMFYPIKIPKVKDWPLMYIVGLLVRAIIISLLMVIPGLSGLVQAPIILAMSIGLILYLAIRRPYSLKYMLVF